MGDWTVLRLGIRSAPGIWLVSSEKKQFLETKMTFERKKKKKKKDTCFILSLSAIKIITC